MDTTIYALTKNERPNCTIEIDILDEYNLGQLFYFFEMVVAYMGYFFDINVYNQPGVEMSKNAMYGLLGQDNFAQHREEFQKFQSGSF
jgi:glucose-6-phosphate isomerase